MTKTATTIKIQNASEEVLAQIAALLAASEVEHSIVTNELVSGDVLGALGLSVDQNKVAEAQSDDSFKAGLEKAMQAKNARRNNVNSQLAAIL